ncbi:hypothetical protein Q5M85_05650 [Paraclostridium bifermentans]|nr:hypothetical protein [Paraclostridium bifermentans]
MTTNVVLGKLNVVKTVDKAIATIGDILKLHYNSYKCRKCYR